MGDAQPTTRELGRGISFGGALDGDGDDAGSWLEERHLDVVREAGFDTVRLPVRWSAHMATTPPYAVDATFSHRVDRAVERGLRRDLNVVLDVHHFDELCADADRHAARFLALWSQIARRYADAGSGLCFEALNEPHEPMTAGRWNDLLAAAVDVIRGSNPERTVIAGPVRWNTVDGLSSLRLPDDARVAVTIHYYSPFRFTHQGADCSKGPIGGSGRRGARTLTALVSEPTSNAHRNGRATAVAASYSASSACAPASTWPRAQPGPRLCAQRPSGSA